MITYYLIIIYYFKMKEVKQMTDFYTKQYCKICKKEVKIDALDFLMNLDKPVVCEKCKREEAKTQVQS